MKKFLFLCLFATVPMLLSACRNCCDPCDPCAAQAVASGPPRAVEPRVAPAVRSTVAKREAPSTIWDSILRKYVEGDYVDYAGLSRNKADRARFQRFLDWQAKADLSSMSREEQIAFYINAYNSLNVKMIVENYPVHSPIDIPGYFDKIKHPVAGESLTVSEVEYDRLIANYKDMRAHFAVVCSDRGCLPIKNGAYKGSTLDADLDAAARKFVQDERHFKVDAEKGEVQISKIFEWYGPKFTQDPKLPAEKPELYLTHWVDADTRSFLEKGGYDLKIIEWNWTINEKAGSTGAATAGNKSGK